MSDGVNDGNGYASKRFVDQAITTYDKEQIDFRKAVYEGLGANEVHKAEVEIHLGNINEALDESRKEAKSRNRVVTGFFIGIIMLFVLEPLARILSN